MVSMLALDPAWVVAVFIVVLVPAAVVLVAPSVPPARAGVANTAHVIMETAAATAATKPAIVRFRSFLLLRSAAIGTSRS